MDNLCYKCSLFYNIEPDLNCRYTECSRCKNVDRKIIAIDMDGVLVAWDKAVEELTEDEKHARMDEKGFFLNLLPMPQALEAMVWLDKHFDVYILSTAPWESFLAWTEKRLWVEKWLPQFKKRLILTHHKHLMKCSYLIDDRTKNGAQATEGELLLFGNRTFPDWAHVIEFLKIQEGIHD